MDLVVLLLALLVTLAAAWGLLLLAMPVAPDGHEDPELERRTTFLQYATENPNLSPAQHMEAWLTLKGGVPDNES